MRILILGARGMLGHALVRACADDAVTAWDQEEFDLTDTPFIDSHIPAVRPEVVINAAAYTNVESAEEHPTRADAVNGTAVGELARICAREHIPLLHLSTDYVFGNEDPAGYTENDEPKTPLNAYGKSKLLGESLLRKHAQTFWLVRTAWLFGPHGRNFVDTILRAGEEKDVLRVIDDQHGNPTYTEDLAAAIRALIQDRPAYGVYHLTNSGEATWADLAKEVFRTHQQRVTVVPISSDQFPLKARRSQWSVLRNTKRPPLRHWRAAVQAYLRSRDASLKEQ